MDGSREFDVKQFRSGVYQIARVATSVWIDRQTIDRRCVISTCGRSGDPCSLHLRMSGHHLRTALVTCGNGSARVLGDLALSAISMGILSDGIDQVCRCSTYIGTWILHDSLPVSPSSQLVPVMRPSRSMISMAIFLQRCRCQRTIPSCRTIFDECAIHSLRYL